MFASIEYSGYYQKFKDYGSRRPKPLTKSHNTYKSDNNNESKGKAHQSHNNYEDNTEYDFESNLDYNDLTGSKDFDPFKYVQDGVSDNFADFGGLGDFGDHFDYNVDYNSEKWPSFINQFLGVINLIAGKSDLFWYLFKTFFLIYSIYKSIKFSDNKSLT